MRHIKPGDICEIVDIHQDDAFSSRAERAKGKKVVVQKIYNEFNCEHWLDADVVLLDSIYPFKAGREIPFNKVRLKRIQAN